ncbi:MAG: aminodeoxychorismate/anthranilate synthase component II [Aquificaceae bacterium]|nr:aminodeoxychorismate/anthranilate synthase component II [Aquificaceae bacterium]MCS7278253.1 aminodeoxychorismate/anthranilate synthase component II [Aquificaceae bacterium]MDW8066988.1 aminodeoxychorismate/anthranilate synthase component II [Aquificaceae bacterium]MDW8423374.1 aminodeoxychorismate/anthranilate synthase component II [Aquificaceae bacterium]
MQVLVIDNYDSFTYNLVHYLQMLSAEVAVRRNDEISLEDIRKTKPEAIVISPGPCTPKEAGISVEVIRNFYREIPILGVCLGHQSIGYAFGASIVRAKNLMHGKTSRIFHTGEGIFEGLKNPFTAVRYHSLVIDKNTLPPFLKVTAWSEDDEIMGIQHKEYPLFGVQFHPESILSEEGMHLLENFLKIARGRVLV